MKYFLSALLILFSSMAWCQSAGGTRPNAAVEAGGIRTAAPGMLSPRVQAGTWEERVRAQPSNADAWLNYFIWDSRTNEARPQGSLEILGRAKQYISGSSQYLLMQYLASGHKDSAALLRAFDRAQDKGWLYPYMVQYAVLSGHRRDLRSYCASLNRIEPVSGAAREYHHNVLMSADSNSTIYARGLNDLVPMAVLQQVYGVRTDVRLRYYGDTIDHTKNAYLVLSLGKKVLAQYPEASCTGLLVRLEAKDGFGEMKRHWERDIKVKELEGADLEADENRDLYRNYLPSMVLLYRYYKEADAAKAARMKGLVQKIADAAGVAVDKLLGSD